MPRKEGESAIEYAKRRSRERGEDFGDLVGDEGLAGLDSENNEGELALALQKIRKQMEKGWSYERAAKLFGIRGHPYFAEFWPPTKYWGDARFYREQMGMSLDDD